MSTRMTKGELQESMGALNPVGHAVLAFRDDPAARDVAKALRDAGFGDEDILVYTSSELFPDLEDMMRNVSGAAGFGYQVTLMRRYMTLASEGAGWLVVFAPDDADRDKLAQVARDAKARTAVHYGRFVQEDLV